MYSSQSEKLRRLVEEMLAQTETKSEPEKKDTYEEMIEEIRNVTSSFYEKLCATCAFALLTTMQMRSSKEIVVWKGMHEHITNAVESVLRNELHLPRKNKE